MQFQLVWRLHGFAEFAFINSHKEKQEVIIADIHGFGGQNRRRLRHGFNYHHARHDGALGGNAPQNAARSR